jgi:hypothetical protein
MATAGELSPRQLINLAPVLSSSDESYRSIEVGGYLRQKGPACLHFRVIYRAPDHYALLIKDGLDGTPLFFAADRKMFLYDPIRSVLLWNGDNNLRFSLAQDEDGLRIHLEVTSDKDRPSNVLVDVKSLLTGPFMNDKVVQTGDKRYQLTRTTQKGNSLGCAIDLEREQPYTNITINLDGQIDPCLNITYINVNGNVNYEEFLLPKRKELAEKILVQGIPNGELARNGSELTLLMRACYARAAIDHPEMRESIKLAGFSEIDWKRVKENDEKFSQVLREALNTASRPK